MIQISEGKSALWWEQKRQMSWGQKWQIRWGQKWQGQMIHSLPLAMFSHIQNITFNLNLNLTWLKFLWNKGDEEVGQRNILENVLTF